jgi:uncharacterized surface protein with fasciclin (FAS1) repeats
MRSVMTFLTLLSLAGSTLAAPRPGDPKPGVLGTAAAAGQFRTLVTAVVAANLVDPLREDGPFTVFAPTDEAFAKLPKDVLDGLFLPENASKLKALLLYHVVPGKLTAAKLSETANPTTLNGARLTIAANRHGIAVDDATVIKADIACRNGLIHVIDRVLTPSKPDILGVAAKSGQFSTLLVALKAAGLDDALKGDGPFTVFAPTDEAFAKLPAKTRKALLDPSNKAKLAEILKYHVVPGQLSARELVVAGKSNTLQGAPVEIKIEGGRILVNDSRLVATDIKADNGVIHVIDTVLTIAE